MKIFVRLSVLLTLCMLIPVQGMKYKKNIKGAGKYVEGKVLPKSTYVKAGLKSDTPVITMKEDISGEKPVWKTYRISKGYQKPNFKYMDTPEAEYTQPQSKWSKFGFFDAKIKAEENESEIPFWKRMKNWWAKIFGVAALVTATVASSDEDKNLGAKYAFLPNGTLKNICMTTNNKDCQQIKKIFDASWGLALLHSAPKDVISNQRHNEQMSAMELSPENLDQTLDSLLTPYVFNIVTPEQTAVLDQEFKKIFGFSPSDYEQAVKSKNGQQSVYDNLFYNKQISAEDQNRLEESAIKLAKIFIDERTAVKNSLKKEIERKIPNNESYAYYENNMFPANELFSPLRHDARDNQFVDPLHTGHIYDYSIYQKAAVLEWIYAVNSLSKTLNLFVLKVKYTGYTIEEIKKIAKKHPLNAKAHPTASVKIGYPKNPLYKLLTSIFLQDSLIRLSSRDEEIFKQNLLEDLNESDSSFLRRQFPIHKK